jgi:hypothetical protein
MSKECDQILVGPVSDHPCLRTKIGRPKLSTSIKVMISPIQGVWPNFGHLNERLPLSKNVIKIVHPYPRMQLKMSTLVQVVIGPIRRVPPNFVHFLEWPRMFKLCQSNFGCYEDKLQPKFDYIQMMGKCNHNQFKLQFLDRVELEYKLAIAILLYCLFHLFVCHSGFLVFGYSLQLVRGTLVHHTRWERRMKMLHTMSSFA